MRWHYFYFLSNAQKHRINSCCLIYSSPQMSWGECWTIKNVFFFQVDFGEVFIPPGLDVPRPRVLQEFKRLAHGLRSSNVSVLDAKTFYIPNLHYDGAGPDGEKLWSMLNVTKLPTFNISAYFWVGSGLAPNIMGIKVPNELGSYDVLRGYQGEDIEIQLPGNLTGINQTFCT